MKDGSQWSGRPVLLRRGRGSGGPGWVLAFSLAILLSVASPRRPQASAQTTPTSQTQAGVHGVVINSVTREPIAHALVFSPDNRFGTMTDDQGRFEFMVPETPGDAISDSGVMNQAQSSKPRQVFTPPDTLNARRPGFIEESRNIGNLGLGADKELTIALIPEALIVGRVTLPSSEPSERIEVEVFRRQVQDGRGRWVSAGTVSAKSNGEFRFADLASGSYKLFTHELMDRDPVTFDPRRQLLGYPPVYFPGATDFSAAGTIVLSPGKTVQTTLSPTRQPYYPVTVTLAGTPPGAPVDVKVSAQGHRGPGYSLGYDGQGITGMLPNGSYTLEATCFGATSLSGVLNITVNGARLAGPVMTLVPNGSIAVKIRDERTPLESGFRGGPNAAGKGFPRNDVGVWLEPADDFALFPERGQLPASPTPQVDSLIVNNVSPGSYWVRVDSSRGFASSISSGGTDLLHRRLVVPPGGSSPAIDVTIRDDSAQVDGVIEGVSADRGAGGSRNPGPPTVLDGRFTGTQESRYYVFFVPLPDSSGRFTEVRASPEGSFSASQLPPGVYRVLAFDGRPSELEYENAEAMRAYDSQGVVVRLTAGQKEQLRLQISTRE